MIKNLTLLLFLLLYAADMYSRKVTSEEAADIAATFLSEQQPEKIRKTPRLYALKAPAKTETEEGYYIFNTEEETPAFVIVAADNRVAPILAYSLTNRFETESLPDHIREWLENYTQSINTLDQRNIPDQPWPQVVTNPQNEAIAPLTASILWGQETPFNDLCPVLPSQERAQAGCVAVAMGIMMRYYEWPQQPEGSFSYTTRTHRFQLSTDLSKSHYDWKVIRNEYETEASEMEKAAVARLIFDCGVAVNMDYNYVSSGSIVDGGRVMINNFGYDMGMQLYRRDYYSTNEWLKRMFAELNAGRPILYRGENSAGGHMFLCDGYDGNGFFHFNWGWYGSNNGYFRLNLLESISSDYGDYTGDGYLKSQMMICNTQPSQNKPRIVPAAVAHYALPEYNIPTIERSAKLPLTTSVLNVGLKECNFIWEGWLTNDENIKQLLFSQNQTLESGSYASFSNFTSLPAAIPNGTYRFFTSYRAINEETPNELMARKNECNYLLVTVGSQSINFAHPERTAALQFTEPISPMGPLCSGKKAAFSISVKNTAPFIYNSYLAFSLKNDRNETIALSRIAVFLEAAETQRLTPILTIPASISPGNYILECHYDITDNFSTTTQLIPPGETNSIRVNISDTSQPAVLTVTDARGVADNEAGYLQIQASIRNTGGAFSDLIRAQVFPEKEQTAVATFNTQLLGLMPQETKTITFRKKLDLPGGKYRISLSYVKEGKYTAFEAGSVNPFYVDYGTGIYFTDTGAHEVYPNPAADYIYIKIPASCQSIQIINLQGKILKEKEFTATDAETIRLDISDLPQGVYLMKRSDDTGAVTKRFMKR